MVVRAPGMGSAWRRTVCGRGGRCVCVRAGDGESRVRSPRPATLAPLSYLPHLLLPRPSSTHLDLDGREARVEGVHVGLRGRVPVRLGPLGRDVGAVEDLGDVVALVLAHGAAGDGGGDGNPAAAEAFLEGSDGGARAEVHDRAGEVEDHALDAAAVHACGGGCGEWRARAWRTKREESGTREWRNARGGIEEVCARAVRAAQTRRAEQVSG
jgi:hypothetical protein